MLMAKKKHQKDRADAIARIQEGKPIVKVSLQSLPKYSRYRFIDPVFDAEGDSIIAHAETSFEHDGEALVKAEFPSGCDPKYVARVLRKFASMLESPDGYDLARLSRSPRGNDNAIRFEDGTFECFNLSRLLEEGSREREEKKRKKLERLEREREKIENVKAINKRLR